jgi:hypothetical protein
MAHGADAPALRFLLLCGGGWIALRTMMVWSWPLPVPPDREMAARTDDDNAQHVANLRVVTATMDPAQPSPALAKLLVRRAAVPHVASAAPGPAGSRADVLQTERLYARQSGVAPFAASAPWFTVPAQADHFGGQRHLSGWSLTGWLYLRDGSGAESGTIGAVSQLGGGQAGLRLAYGFGEGRVRAYGRATAAVRRLEQREIAFGLTVSPLAHVPVDVAIEQRVGAGKGGRTALAAMVTGGVSEVALPARFRVEAYAQAGIVGARRRDGFADGAIVIDRHLGSDATSPLRLGVVAAAAVQPGASRVDVGPRLTIRLPDLGQGGRIALDWRQRIAGDASPKSGIALTLTADF